MVIWQGWLLDIVSCAILLKPHHFRGAIQSRRTTTVTVAIRTKRTLWTWFWQPEPSRALAIRWANLVWENLSSMFFSIPEGSRNQNILSCSFFPSLTLCSQNPWTRKVEEYYFEIGLWHFSLLSWYANLLALIPRAFHPIHWCFSRHFEWLSDNRLRCKFWPLSASICIVSFMIGFLLLFLSQ